MLDFDLAKIYGYETKRFNEQVKNNKEKFDEDFMLRLTKDEVARNLKSFFSTSSWGGTRKLPYAFTEQGIYMLMTVLRGELAIKQSKTLIRLFKQMKDYIIENNSLLSFDGIVKLTQKVDKHGIEINDIKDKLEVVMDNFIDPSTYKRFLILNGEKIEADIAYQKIYSLAKHSIYIVDDYIDIKTFQLLKIIDSNIEVVVFTDNKARNSVNSGFIKDFMNDTGIMITFKQNENKFHDRYIIIDYKTDNETIFHCGASSKDAGNKITTISKIDEKELYKEKIEKMLNNDELVIK